MLIDTANPGGRNVIKKKAEKTLKCKYLITEIQCMWKVRAKVIPVIITVIETISKSCRQYLSNLPRKYEIKGPQKTAILVTAHELRKVLT